MKNYNFDQEDIEMIAEDISILFARIRNEDGVLSPIHFTNKKQIMDLSEQFLGSLLDKILEKRQERIKKSMKKI